MLSVLNCWTKHRLRLNQKWHQHPTMWELDIELHVNLVINLHNLHTSSCYWSTIGSACGKGYNMTGLERIKATLREHSRVVIIIVRVRIKSATKIIPQSADLGYFLASWMIHSTTYFCSFNNHGVYMLIGQTDKTCILITFPCNPPPLQGV